MHASSLSAESDNWSVLPYEGIEGQGRTVRFGMTIDDIQTVLGAGRALRRGNHGDRWPNELLYTNELPLCRFIFSEDDRRCEFIEFVNPLRHPPLVDSRRVEGPSLRQAAELLVSLGYEPDEESAEDLHLGRLGVPGSPGDSIDFAAIGLTLWSDMSTEADEHGHIGEYVLGSVATWSRAYGDREVL